MKPSIGRIVHYRRTEQDVNDLFVDFGTAGGGVPEVGEVVAAQISRVNPDGSVNLRVMPDGPGTLCRASVFEGSADAFADGFGLWCWPPRVGE